MKATFAVIFLVCGAASVLLFSCGRPPDKTLAITHVTVIDMSGAPALPDQTVLIQGQRISAVGATNSVALRRGTPILNGSGKFLIPGLVDMHVHLTAAGEPEGSRKFMIPLLLANGITSVRDMGGYLESLLPLRKEIKEGKRLGPSIACAGPYLDGSPPSFQPSLVVASPSQADEDVRQLVQRGVDFIKVQSLPSREAYFAVAEAAKRQQVPFVGHVPDRVTAAEAADAGQHSIEHLTNVLRGCSSEESRLMREQFYVPPVKEAPQEARRRVVRWQQKLLDSYSQRTAEALIAKFVEREVWQTPTLVLLKSSAFPTLEDLAPRVSSFRGLSSRSQAEARSPAPESDPRLQYIPQATLENWKRARSEQMRFATRPETDLRSQLLARSSSLIREMQRAGVGILAGTDTPAPYVFPGFALHHELQLLVAAGLTPGEALQTATSRPSEFLRTSKDSGTILAGKYADLVLLDANPLADIRNTQKIHAVILRGNLLDRPALDGFLAQARRFAAGQ